jgi:tRNA(Arg) A34 adenosine deaminase TadA
MIINKFMQEALNQAKIAFEKDEVPVGCVVVCDGKIIAKSHNQNRTLNDAFAHAEILALKEASRIKNSPRLDDCDLYVTLEPCIMCFGAISWAKIKNIYFAASDEKFGAISSGKISPHYFRPEIYSGISEAKSQKLLQDFFKSKR